MVICMEITVPLLVPDNMIGTCASCGKGLQFRPIAEPAMKVCMECAPDLIEGSAAPTN